MFLGIVVVRYMIHSFKKPKAAAAESSCNYGVYSDYSLQYESQWHVHFVIEISSMLQISFSTNL